MNAFKWFLQSTTPWQGLQQSPCKSVQYVIMGHCILALLHLQLRKGFTSVWPGHWLDMNLHSMYTE